MLKYNKIKTDFGYTINIYDSNKILTITFGGNLDLYWYLSSKEKRKQIHLKLQKKITSFISLFDILYNDIVNCNLFKVYNEELSFVNSIKELQKIYNRKKELNIIFSEYEEYKRLYNGEYICWYSDDDSIEDANYVKIIKDDYKYILEFFSNFKSNTLWLSNTIRFRNSGSRYMPFNMIFMEMYNSLCTSDYDENQIHIEEYLYKKKKRQLITIFLNT